MAISLGDIKKKKLKVPTIELNSSEKINIKKAPSSKTNNQTISLADIKSGKSKIEPIKENIKTHAQQYNLDGSKKIAPTVSITTNNIDKRGATNLISSSLQQDIKNKTFQAATEQNKQQINLAGDSTLTKSQKQELREKTAEEKKKINENLPQMVSADSVKNKSDDLVKDLSKKTGYSEQEVTDFINDYNNGRWDSTKPKYRNASYKFKEAGTEVYLAAKEYDKYKPTLNKQLSPLENTAQSSVNALIETGKGIVDFSEGVLDAGVQLGSSKYNPMMWITTGQTPWSKDQSKLDNYQDIAKEIVSKDASQNFIDNELGYGKTLSDGRTIQETLDEGALIKSDNLGGQVFRNIGTQLPGLMTGSEAGSLATMGISSFGSGVEQAYNQGATRGEATGYGLLNSGIEVATEKMFSGVGGVLGKGELDDAIINGINKNIKNELTQKLTSFGIKSLGEGAEEFFGDLLQPMAQKLTYASEEDLIKLYKDQNYLEDFVSGVLSAAIMQGSTMPINNQNQIQIKNQVKEIVNKDNANQVFNDILKNNKNLSEWEVANIVNNALKETNQKSVDFSKNVVQNETTQGTYSNTPQNSQETGQNQELSNETTNTSNQIKRANVIENSKSFSEQVDDVVNNKYPKRDMLVVTKNTPKILQDIGLADLPITMTQKHLYTMTHEKGKYQNSNYHNIDLETIKKLPEALERPLNILQSDTKENSIVVVTELVDNNDDIIVASIKIDGKGTIQDIRIDTNVMTSAYGKSGNYDYFMKDNIKKGNLLYDIDEGIIKRINRKLQLRPTDSLSKLDVKDRVQFPMRDSNGINSISDIPKNISPISDNNDTTKTQKSQIAPVSSQYSMQQNKKNDTKNVNAPIGDKYKKKTNTIDERINKKEETIKVSQMSDKEIKKISNTIAEQINKDGGFELKQRRWVETATKSEVLNNAISIEDLDASKTHYEPTSNKKTLEKANKQLDTLGYEESIKYIEQKMNDERASAKDIALAERLIQEAIKKGDMTTAQDLIMNTAILGTEYGQTIQALSIIQRLTPEGQLKMLDKIVSREKSRGNKTFEGVEISPQMVEKILKAYNNDGTYDQDDLNKRVEEVKQEIAGQLKTTFGEKADAWRYLSMLGNPKTHIRNIVSNIAMKGTIAYKNAIARTIETAIPIKNRTKTWKKSSEVVKNFAKEQAEELRSVISGETKYSEKASIEAKKTIFKTKFLEKLYQGNSTLLDLEDWLFSKSAFESTFKEYLTAQGIRTEQDIQNNPKIITEAQNYSIEQAQIATFRQYSKIASEINKLERKYKGFGLAIKAVMPFKKTPVNIAKAGVSYSPLGLIKNLTYDMAQVIKGNMEASQYIDNLSQGLSGTSLTLLGYALAKAGILKGDDDNDKESKYDSALGNKAYTIKLGENYYSLSWLSPVGMPLFVGANAYKELEENKEIDMNVVTDMLTSTINPISEMSLVSSLTDAIKSFSTNGTASIESSIENAIKSYVGQYFPTLLSQIASLTDAKKRSTSASSNSKWKYGEEVLNSIKYKIPGLRQTLPTYTDSWGKPQKQAENIFVRAWETFIAPYTRYEDKKTNLDKEIMEVYYKSGNVDVIPGTPNSYITYNKERYNMSNKEYETFKKTYGTTSNNYIKAIIKNDRYKSATYEDKAKIIDKVYDYALTNAQLEYFNKHNIEIDSNYTNQSEAKKLEIFKEYNYSYSDIAEIIISNYYKYKRD